MYDYLMGELPLHHVLLVTVLWVAAVYFLIERCVESAAGREKGTALAWLSGKWYFWALVVLIPVNAISLVVASAALGIASHYLLRRV